MVQGISSSGGDVNMLVEFRPFSVILKLPATMNIPSGCVVILLLMTLHNSAFFEFASGGMYTAAIKTLVIIYNILAST